MDNIGSVGQAVHHNYQQINKADQSSISYTDNEFGVFADALNSQGSERPPSALNLDAIKPLLMELITMLNNSLGTGMQGGTSSNNNVAHTMGSESPIATSIGDGFQSSLMDNAPFVGLTRVNSAGNIGSATNTATGSVNTNQTSHFGSPIVSQLGGGIQALLGNITSSSTGSDTSTVNPSHWRRGSSSLS